ncbi:hypothetical protein [Mannheimia haemolytica]|uniref:hypothetical protein n=1 Tax=Mannheimia haemolytica TaxID=75985 RepID=UPI000385D6E1|nr:hypothetical protein [Mannheimia haemolytica]EPY98839.1 hypothetical protein L278_12215 [Mannheimia haemolytica D35]MCB4226580.1 hypothetical protein [Mannheimia haemolytica]MDW1151010.1 hypothetical protein [Mannheimia haemolytica]MDW1161168.1 hypothetical protein [Mannheimia haemolytica]MEE3731478.1 hypothetical protein [Mannheimia haemolytica]
MTKCYAVILNAPLFDGGAVMPIIEAFFADRKAANRFKSKNPIRQEVREISPTDYTVTILLAMGIVAIPAKGFKHYQQAEKALPPLKAVMPNHHFEIVKFCDTALYKRNQQEGKL